MSAMRSIIFEFVGFLLILSLLCPVCEQKEEECSYTLEVETSCWPHVNPGTGDPVSVRFGDKSFDDMKGKGEVVERSLSEVVAEKGKKPFQRCNTDKFKLSGPCLQGNVCYLYFKVEGKDSWHVEGANVYSRKGTDTFHLKHRVTKKAWDGRDHCKSLPMLASDQDTNTSYNHQKSNAKSKRELCLAKAVGKRGKGPKSC